MIRALKDAGLDGKKVVVRVDFNVPLDDEGNVREDERISAALPTIRHLLERGCRIILMSHLGRPKGRVDERLRMGSVAARLEKLLEKRVLKLDDCVGEGVRKAADEMREGDVIMLENLRFHPEEEANDEGFAKKLASLADFYVNDAFGASHRAHASVVGITAFLPSCAGFLLEAEIRALDGILRNPKRPFVAVLGGVKISDKLRLVNSLLGRVDKMLIGGAMAFTFIKGGGNEIGRSRVEDDFVGKAHELLKSGKIVLPVDFVEASEFKPDASRRVVPAGRIDPEHAGMDIGPETVRLFRSEIEKAGSVVWNGPMGVFEFEGFAAGTKEVAGSISGSGAVTVIGGGDTLAAAKSAGVCGRFSHTSTGGGAMLRFLEGKSLPAIDALEKNA